MLRNISLRPVAQSLLLVSLIEGYMLVGCLKDDNVASVPQKNFSFSLTECLLERALDVGPAILHSCAPLFKEEFDNRMCHATEPKDVDKVRDAAKIWADPDTQARILSQDDNAVELLNQAGLTTTEFTNTISIIEHILMRSQLEKSKEELGNDLKEIRAFIEALKRDEIHGPGLAQWELIAYLELQVLEQLEAIDLPLSIVQMFESHKIKAQAFLSGNSQVDWMSGGKIAEMERALE